MSKFAILLIGFFSVSVSSANVFNKYLGTYSVQNKPAVQGTPNCNAYSFENLATVSLEEGSKSDSSALFSLLLTDTKGNKSEIPMNKELENLGQTPEQYGSAIYYFSEVNSHTGFPYVAYRSGVSDLTKTQNFSIVIEETAANEVRLTITNSAWSKDLTITGCSYSVELKKK